MIKNGDATADGINDDDDGDAGDGGVDDNDAAGAVLEAVDRVLHGEAHNAFCAVRPPGHHAGVELHCMGAVSNGFCILNNVALAALYAHHYG